MIRHQLMKLSRCPQLLLILEAVGALQWTSSLAQSADPGWPRVLKENEIPITVHQPQVDYWHGCTNLHFRCAIAVKGVLKDKKYGVVEVDALRVTDHEARVVALVPLTRDLRFAGVTDSERTRRQQTVNELRPLGTATTLSLDRLIAYFDPAAQLVQRTAELILAPPKILSGTTPAILVIFMVEPRFRPVETNRTDLLFALITNCDILYDSANRQYNLWNGEPGHLRTGPCRRNPGRNDPNRQTRAMVNARNFLLACMNPTSASVQ